MTGSAEGPTGAQAPGLDALTRLAGGIGHEFRNLLMIIQNYAELVGEQLTAGSQAAEDLAEIVQAADRAALLTNQLLAFGGTSSAGVRSIDVAQAIEAIAPRIRALLGDGLALRIELEPDLPRIEGDPGRFGQLLEHVARHAVETLDGGSAITIAAGRARPVAGDGLDITPASHVAITIANADEELDAPLPSADGVGGGLGLALARGIVESRGGTIRISSQKGVGTIVRTLLPVSAQPEECAADPTGRRVLVCEDERAIRVMCERTLRRAGFDVMVAEDGDAGLRVLGEELAAGRRLDLLVSDIVMPGSSGFDVAAAARDGYPDVSILLMSGYSEELGRRVPPTGTLLLEKPFGPSVLLRGARTLAAS
jgi:two-component system cell cycle sensor histidine kinase/response regulator CckA